MKVLVTGVAGFIGSYLARYLLGRGDFVVGVDNLNDYYDVDLKKSRLSSLDAFDLYRFYKVDISNSLELEGVFERYDFDVVVNLAAQAGVRYSIENPSAYVDSNLVGFANILECCRNSKVANLVFASSSSVYGANEKYPFEEDDSVDHPVSLYAATKKSNELMAHSYASLYGMSVTGLRFFTVYGPEGRPDMAPFIFTDNILKGNEIKVFNNGEMFRDFTYIDDIVDGIVDVIDYPADANYNWDPSNPKSSTSYCKYRILNIGNDKPTRLMDFIYSIEKSVGKKAKIKFMPMQAGDVIGTSASIKKLKEINGFSPKVDVNEGVSNFVSWFLKYYKV